MNLRQFFARSTTLAVFVFASRGLAQPVTESNPILRIGLVRLFGRADCIFVSAPDGAKMLDSHGTVEATGPATWTVTAKATGVICTAADGTQVAADSRLRIEPPSVDAPTALSLTEFGKPTPAEAQTLPLTSRGRRSRRSSRPAAQIGYPYRGAIEISAVPNAPRLRIVNELPLETYLRGVIASEMPDTAAPEALKCQAIAARTYALMDRNRFRSQGYDLIDTTTSQVYGGVRAERPSTDAAVLDTAGLVVTRNDHMVFVDYYDDCGGATAAGSSPDDYPPSVADHPADGGPDYCARGTYHTWSFSLSREEFCKVVPASVAKRIGTVKSLEISQIDESGRVRRVAWVGEDGTRSEMKGYELRSLLGTDRLKSTLFTITAPEDGSVRFEGRGWGHGHGMCQMGAMGLAAAPFNRTCREILEHYFPGSKVEPIEALARVEKAERNVAR